VKASTIGIRMLADYSVGLKDRQQSRLICPQNITQLASLALAHLTHCLPKNILYLLI
jgi:hypothetical protein